MDRRIERFIMILDVSRLLFEWLAWKLDSDLSILYTHLLGIIEYFDI